MSDDKTFSWRDGMPTKPDVDALLKRWPEPNIGDRYEYETVAEVIGYEPGSQRFKTVTDAWRRRVHEKGFVIECDPGAAFFVANADQITAGTYSALNSSARKLRRQRKNLTIARAENDEQRSTIMHQGRLLAETERHLKKAKMNALPTLTADDDRPRISPPVAGQQGRREMNNNPTQLLHDALAASATRHVQPRRCQGTRAAILMQESADRLRHEVRCIRPSVSRIDFEPLDADEPLGELTIDDLPRYLRRQAE